MTINSVVKKMIRISVNGYHKPLPSSFKTSVVRLSRKSVQTS